MKLITDKERREVARKLRAGAEYLPNDMYSDDLELELAKTVCKYDTPSVDVLFNRLADLIEPSIPSDPGEAGLACVDAFIREHTEKQVDRDALLALADEIEIDGAGALDDGDWCKPLLVEYARRIREALGVQDG